MAEICGWDCGGVPLIAQNAMSGTVPIAFLARLFGGLEASGVLGVEQVLRMAIIIGIEDHMKVPPSPRFQSEYQVR